MCRTCNRLKVKHKIPHFPIIRYIVFFFGWPFSTVKSRTWCVCIHLHGAHDAHPKIDYQREKNGARTSGKCFICAFKMCSIDEKKCIFRHYVMFDALRMNWNAFWAFWNLVLVYFWCLLSAAQPILFLYQHGVWHLFDTYARFRLCRPLFTFHFISRLVNFSFWLFSWNICALRMRNAAFTSCSMFQYFLCLT